MDVPYGHPNFGVLISCECRLNNDRERVLEKLTKIGNLEPFKDKTFATFDGGVHGVELAYRKARAFAEHPQGWFILFSKGYGCGKTHLVAAIANSAVEKRIPVLFAIVPDLLDHLRNTFAPSSEVTYDERFELVRSIHLLILDDLGTENATPWAREKLYQIFNHRYNYRLPTVITSNREPKDIDPRILSRMEDTALCPERIIIDAADYRRTISTQRFSEKKQDHLRRMGRREPRER
jgi:DNA replication protein DnaC